METKTLTMPEDAVINMLKSLPEDDLIDIFWKTLVKGDVSPISKEEREDIERAKVEFEKGETIKWEDIR